MFGSLAALRDLVMLWKFSFSVHPDTASYFAGDPLRSRPYPIMAWVTGAPDHPLNLVLLQIILGGLAVAALVYVISRMNAALAIAIGILFVIDINWGRFNRTLLTEGPLMSFMVLSLAVFIHQYNSRSGLRPWSLIGAGALFAWMATIRPSNLYLLPLIGVAYLIFTRSISKVALVAGGIGIVLVAMGLLTLAQTGRFRISAGTGYFVAFPLFSYQIFDPANGPASKAIDTTLKQCDPMIDYSQVAIQSSNEHLWGSYFPCLKSHQWSFDRIDGEMTDAYVEAIRTHPEQWLYQVAGWTSIDVVYPLVRLDPAVDPYRVMADRSISWLFVPAVALFGVLLVSLIWWGARGSVRWLGFASVAVILYVSIILPVGHVFLPRYVEVLTPLDSVTAGVCAMGILNLVSSGVARLHRRQGAPLRIASEPTATPRPNGTSSRGGMG